MRLMETKIAETATLLKVKPFTINIALGIINQVTIYDVIQQDVRVDEKYLMACDDEFEPLKIERDAHFPGKKLE